MFVVQIRKPKLREEKSFAPDHAAYPSVAGSVRPDLMMILYDPNLTSTCH